MTSRPQQWKDKGEYLEYKKHKIFYREEGVGDALFLIHGFPTSSWDWWKIWDELVRKYRVIALDLIGFGFSDKPHDYNYSILDQADIVERLASHLSIKEAKILAHDYGDTVSQELLARHNRNNCCFDIKSICFLNGGLFPETHHPRLIQTLLMSPIGFIIGKLFNKKKLHANFDAIFGPNTQPTDQEIDEFWSLCIYNSGNANMHKLISYMA